MSSPQNLNTKDKVKVSPRNIKSHPASPHSSNISSPTSSETRAAQKKTAIRNE